MANPKPTQILDMALASPSGTGVRLSFLTPELAAAFRFRLYRAKASRKAQNRKDFPDPSSEFYDLDPWETVSIIRGPESPNELWIGCTSNGEAAIIIIEKAPNPRK